MEEEIKPADIEELEQEEIPETQPDPFELISEKFKEQEGKIINCLKYIKVLNEEIKILKSNFKLLLEEKE